jgi:hypothetical protein
MTAASQTGNGIGGRMMSVKRPMITGDHSISPTGRSRETAPAERQISRAEFVRPSWRTEGGRGTRVDAEDPAFGSIGRWRRSDGEAAVAVTSIRAPDWPATLLQPQLGLDTKVGCVA